jgi:outer membrane lipoprotein SlyB
VTFRGVVAVATATAWLALAAGCAPAPPPVAVAPPEAANLGVIVSMRAIPPQSNASAAVLGAVGSAAAVAPGAGPAYEFIVREDNGQTVSVVQSNDQKLRPGDRTALLGGPHARLERAPD